MQGTASLYRASDSLARSHQVAAETDQIGTEIISELDIQRESLLRTRDRVSMLSNWQ
jgi:vesicle transport through interaction with t-SNAREs 1